MKHSIALDRINRAVLPGNMTESRRIKAVRSNFFLRLSCRSGAAEEVSLLLPFLTRAHHYCLVTGRSRAVYRPFFLSRGTLKTFVGLRFLHGLRRSSW
jgi:ribosomal protein S14